jgi:conjugal transfer mating pair stabilization protein TraN
MSCIGIVAAQTNSGVTPMDTMKCGFVEKVCAGGRESRYIDGMEVTRDCWNFNVVYACIHPAVTNTCKDMEANGATYVNSNCSDGLTIDGKYYCITEERNYSFVTKDPSTSSTTDCAGQQFCVDGKCFDAGSEANPDFKRAVTGLEAGREGGVYLDEGNFRLFTGQDNRCSKSAMKNCCKKVSRINQMNFTNREVAGGKNSKYNLDVLGSNKSPIFNQFFNQRQYVDDLVKDVMQGMLSCDKDEARIAVKKDKRLCVYIGDYCSRKVRIGLTKICVEHKESYCCYNSRLGRIINEAAHQQIPGLSWGSADNPNCSGLTVEQFTKLDFNRIDFTEFFDEIVPGPGVTQEEASDRAAQKIKSYYQ